MDCSEYFKIKDKLNNIKFNGLEQYNMGKALTVPLSYAVKGYSLVNSFKSIIIGLLFDIFEYNYITNENAKHLFIFSMDYSNREDHRKNFNNITELNEFEDILLAKGKTKKNLKPSNLSALFYIPFWFNKLIFSGCNFKQALFLLGSLIKSYNLKRATLKNVDIKKYRLAVVYFDAALSDNIIAQTFKNAGIKTATLQHGHFVATIHNSQNIDDIGVGFEGFVCDYFLSWGEYTNQEAISEGINKKSLITLGIPKYIDCKRKLNKTETGIYGLVLGSQIYKNQNMELIKLANEFSKKVNKKYILRLHPTSNYEDYREYVSHAAQFKVCEKTQSVLDFSNEIDFALVYSSSVYAELIFLNVPCFRYVGENDDIYKNITWDRFFLFEELMKVYDYYEVNQTQSKKKLEETKTFLCAAGDIGKNYKDFFDSFIG